MTMTTNKSVKIRPSIFTYAFSLILFGVSVYLFRGLYAAIQQQILENSNTIIKATLAFTIYGLIAISILMFGLNISLRKYEVSLKGVHIKTLFRNVFIDWESVKKMLIIPTFQGANNIGLLLKDGRRYGLSIAILAHYPFSENAIVEAAHLANPDIEMDAGLGLKNGNPPYGIFLDLPEV